MGRILPTRVAVALLALVLTCLVAFGAIAGPAGAEPAKDRICSFVSIPEIIEGGGMELIVSGPGHLPTCRRVKRIVHLVPKRLPPRSWGMVVGWRCMWTRLGGVECSRGAQGIVAYPGGDRALLRARPARLRRGPREGSGGGWHNANCGLISVREIERGSAMELIVYGDRGPLPSCRLARHKARSVPELLPKATWGIVGGWRCRWSSRTVLCRRHGNWIVEATPGGD